MQQLQPDENMIIRKGCEKCSFSSILYNRLMIQLFKLTWNSSIYKRNYHHISKVERKEINQ